MYLSTGSLEGDSYSTFGVFAGVVGTVDAKLSSSSSKPLCDSSLMCPSDPPCSYNMRLLTGVSFLALDGRLDRDGSEGTEGVSGWKAVLSKGKLPSALSRLFLLEAFSLRADLDRRRDEERAATKDRVVSEFVFFGLRRMEPESEASEGYRR